MTITRFEEIEAWIKARELTVKIFEICRSEKLKHEYALQDQIKRSTISIMTNIAEGFDSGTDKSFANFLSYAYRSASETHSILYILIDLGYISESACNELTVLIDEIKGLIFGLRKYLIQS